MSYAMRTPCIACGHEWGSITHKNGQDCVYCGGCGKFQYNAPKTETGRAVRSVSTTQEAIKPKQRTRIVERATGRCEICGSRSELHVGHILSVADGHRYGLTDDVINSDENLICACAQCNLGGGKATISLRLAVAILTARYHGGDADGPAAT